MEGKSQVRKTDCRFKKNEKKNGYLPVVFQYVLPLELYHWLIDSWTFLMRWDLGDLGTWPLDYGIRLKRGARNCD